LDIKNTGEEKKKRKSNKKNFSDEFLLSLVGERVIVEIANNLPETYIFSAIVKRISKIDIHLVNGGAIRKVAILEVKTYKQIKKRGKKGKKKVVLFHGLTKNNDVLNISVLAHDRYAAFLEIPEIFGLKSVLFVREKEGVKWAHEKNVFIRIVHPFGSGS